MLKWQNFAQFHKYFLQQCNNLQKNGSKRDYFPQKLLNPGDTYVQIAQLAVGVVLDVLDVHPQITVAGPQVMISVVVRVQRVRVVDLDAVEQDIGAGPAESLPLSDCLSAMERKLYGPCSKLPSTTRVHCE